MPIDPQAQTILNMMAEANLPPTNTLSPAQVRTNFRLRPIESGPEHFKVEDCMVPGESGLLTARIYVPKRDELLPILVWFHGGGWVVGDLDTTDGTARQLAEQGDCIIASIDYRLAPETKFPGPVEDCYAATRWIAEHASEFGGDTKRIGVGGASAGANLATCVSLMSRDREAPSLMYQLLVYPVTGVDFNTNSYLKNADGYGLTRDTMIWYWDQYLKDDSDKKNPYAVPSVAQEFTGLPAALIISAGFDPLCDDASSYAELLRQGNNSVEYYHYEGMIHGFFGMTTNLDIARKAVSDAAAAMKAAFANHS